VAPQATVGRVVTGTAGIGRVRAVRLRVVAMTGAKGATAIGRGKVQAGARSGTSRSGATVPRVLLARGGPEKAGWRSSKGSSKCGLLARVATELTETDRVPRAVRRGDVGMTTARLSEVLAGRTKGKSGTSRSEAPAPRVVRPRQASGPSPA
jgi:hypothetical protein